MGETTINTKATKDIEKQISHQLDKLCPFCFGSGKLKEMQSAATFNGASIRCKNTTMPCRHCSGTGRK